MLSPPLRERERKRRGDTFSKDVEWSCRKTDHHMNVFSLQNRWRWPHDPILTSGHTGGVCHEHMFVCALHVCLWIPQSFQLHDHNVNGTDHCCTVRNVWPAQLNAELSYLHGHTPRPPVTRCTCAGQVCVCVHLLTWVHLPRTPCLGFYVNKCAYHLRRYSWVVTLFMNMYIHAYPMCTDLCCLRFCFTNIMFNKFSMYRYTCTSVLPQLPLVCSLAACI